MLHGALLYLVENKKIRIAASRGQPRRNMSEAGDEGDDDDDDTEA